MVCRATGGSSDGCMELLRQQCTGSAPVLCHVGSCASRHLRLVLLYTYSTRYGSHGSLRE
eukprot:6953228-Prymnesium_polylepis.1